jgi:hypothetical protein
MDLVTSSNNYGSLEVPVSWSVQKQSNNWWTYKSPSGADFAVHKINQSGSLGLFAIFGSQDILETRASGSNTMMPAKEAWRRRAETPIRTTLRFWRHWIVDGVIRIETGTTSSTRTITSESVTLCSYGNSVPDPISEPLPWNLNSDGQIVPVASASIRVTNLRQPTLLTSIAGLSMNALFESEPDRSGSG